MIALGAGRDQVVHQRVLQRRGALRRVPELEGRSLGNSACAFFTPASASFQKSDEAFTTKASFGLSWAMAPDDSTTPAASAAARVIRDFIAMSSLCRPVGGLFRTTDPPEIRSPPSLPEGGAGGTLPQHFLESSLATADSEQ